MAFLKLIRYQNLLLLALMQLIFRYGFLATQNIPLAMKDWQYALFVLATICIAAGGYLINNIFDQETDAINKPENVVVGKKISEQMGYNIYIVLNILGFGIGYYLSDAVGKPAFASAFFIIPALLYVYANGLKQMMLIGNVVIAFLLGLSILMVGIFDLIPMTFPETQAGISILMGILIDYAIFAFILNLIREIVKDLEDVNGDYNMGMNTLPIALGVSRTAKIVFGLSFIPMGLIIFYINENLFPNNRIYSSIYGLVFILGPLIYFSTKIFSAKNKKDFAHLSKVLKWIIFFGILSIAIINFEINYAK